MIRLYHGSNMKIEELRYAKGVTFQYFFGSERALQLLKRQ